MFSMSKGQERFFLACWITVMFLACLGLVQLYDISVWVKDHVTLSVKD